MWRDALLIPPETLYFLLHPIQRFQADKKRLTLARWHYSRVDVIKICGNEVSFASSAQCVFIFPYLLLSDSCDHRWVARSVANNFDNDWRHRAKCVKPFLACRRHRVGHIANFWDLNEAAAIGVCLQEVCDCERHTDSRDDAYIIILDVLRIQVNTWHTCAPLYSAPAAYILQNAALQTWQQYARWSLLGAQLSHLLPFLFSAQSSASAWLGWDVKWQLLLLQRRLSYEGHAAQRKIKPSVRPGHDTLLLYGFPVG